jgi:poly(3-hydroxybutyrate) depolymerase
MAGRHLSLAQCRRRGCRALCAAFVVALTAVIGDNDADAAELASTPLPRLCIDGARVSVSGISSGGFMANQFHVAHSATVMGAAIFAAGPYKCAGNNYPESLFRALGVCSDVFSPLPLFFGPPDTQTGIDEARHAATAGEIDPLGGLRGDRVYLFSGRDDTFVPTSVMDALAGFYLSFVDKSQITYVADIDAAHAMVTKDYGNPCTSSKPPFLNDCDFDLAGDALERLYGPLAPKTSADGNFVTFDQSEFVDGSRTHGLSARGYAYVPKGCAAQAGCRLHVAFHGCLQNAETVGDAFYRHAGYNEWAEANDIVILYPQAAELTTKVLGIPLPWPNAQGCWDWWGFTGPDYADKRGPQIAAVSAMIDRLADGCTRPPQLIQ